MPDGAGVIEIASNAEVTPAREWINRGAPFWPSINIEKAEAAYKAVYIGDFCILQRNGNWSEMPVCVFYIEHPEKAEYSNYLGLFLSYAVWDDPSTRSLMVTDAKSVTEGEWNGVMATNGEIIYSRYRHDYRVSRDGTVTVDGGRDYFKVKMHGVGCKTLRISVVRDKLVVNDTLFFPVRDDPE